MTKKYEMAEWILDFFRRAKANADQIILMRNVQNKLHELNPKERDMFVSVANELIQNGYFTYEEGTPQVLRLTEKGRDYIYNPYAELDCCYDLQKLSQVQSQYLSNLRNSLVSWVNGVQCIVNYLSIQPMATDEDRKALTLIKTILSEYEVNAVEEHLSNGMVTDDDLDMIENMNKRLVDTIIEHIKTDDLVKDFLRRLCYLMIEQGKSTEEMRLNTLRIPKG